ncbi:poly (beta-D-mannuronate) lyase [Vibrio astriarenae]|nr:poly (beta-D-mannuronate) lyase [Vibrio sp. C7]
MFTSIAYSCVASTMTQEERDRIIERVFIPMIEMSTEKYAYRFDHIHNHGVWAVAAVGACAVAINRPEYLEMAVYGKDREATSGFLDQVSNLFAPSGYYLEGPYYSRFTIRLWFCWLRSFTVTCLKWISTTTKTVWLAIPFKPCLRLLILTAFSLH